MKCLIVFLFSAVHLLGQTISLASAGYSAPELPAFAPGQLVTLFVSGPSFFGYVVASTLPLPRSLAGISVSAKQPMAGADPIPVPILSVEFIPGPGPVAVTVQIPFELIPNTSPSVCPTCPPSIPPDLNLLSTQLAVSQGSLPTSTYTFVPTTAVIHVVRGCDLLLPPDRRYDFSRANLCDQALVTNSRGELILTNNPIKPGDTAVAYAVGLGPTADSVASGSATPKPVATKFPVTVSFSYVLPALAVGSTASASLPISQQPPAFAGLVQGFVGLYQVNFVVPQAPSNIAACEGKANLLVTITGAHSSDSFGICVSPGG